MFADRTGAKSEAGVGNLNGTFTQRIPDSAPGRGDPRRGDPGRGDDAVQYMFADHRQSDFSRNYSSQNYSDQSHPERSAYGGQIGAHIGGRPAALPVLAGTLPMHFRPV